jgi:predicted GNAT family acetyltransferase
MQVERFYDMAAYAAAAEPFLLRREAENCFFLGQLTQLKDPVEAVLLVLWDGPEVVAVASMTPPRHLMMTAAPPPAARAVVDYLRVHQIAVPGVGGPTATAETFANHWCEATVMTPREHVRYTTFELTEVTPPPPASGAIRRAEQRDVDLLGEWVQSFREEIGEGHLGGSRELAAERVRDGEMWLWDDAGKPVAMAGAIAPTRNGIRIVLVYTVPRRRGRGYASNLVAALSQRQLDAGRKFCFLNTDVGNPTSNKIYRAMGYRPVGESVTLMFDRAADAR